MARGGGLREIRIRVGHCERFWERNCVAIGLAGGFIEPLESTGIYLIELGVKYLVEHWPQAQITPAHRWGYNHLMRDAYQEVLEFVFLHYYTSQRTDTPFWTDFKERMASLPGHLQDRLELWRHKYPSNYDARAMAGKVFGYESLIAILSGMDWFRGARSPYVLADPRGLRQYVQHRLGEYQEQVAGFPSHEKYLASHGVPLSREMGVPD